MTESFSAGDVATKSFDHPLSQQLLTPTTIPLTPSFEDLASIASGVSTPQLPHESSGSNESLEEDETAVTNPSSKTRSSFPNTSPVLWKRRNVGVREKRERFQTSRCSSADMIAPRGPREVEEDHRKGSGDFKSRGDGGSLSEKRKILLRIHQATESDPTLSSYVLHVPPSEEKERLQGGSVSRLVETSQQLEQERVARGGGGGSMRHRHVNKATGVDL